MVLPVKDPSYVDVVRMRLPVTRALPPPRLVQPAGRSDPGPAPRLAANCRPSDNPALRTTAWWRDIRAVAGVLARDGAQRTESGRLDRNSIWHASRVVLATSEAELRQCADLLRPCPVVRDIRVLRIHGGVIAGSEIRSTTWATSRSLTSCFRSAARARSACEMIPTQHPSPSTRTTRRT